MGSEPCIQMNCFTKKRLITFDLISNLVGTILNDFNSSEANKLNEYRLLKKARLNRLSKLFR
jgi:hypothetical protein